MSIVPGRRYACPVCGADVVRADTEEIELPPVDGWRMVEGGATTFSPCGCVESKAQREARRAVS